MAGEHESSDGGHRIGTTVSDMVKYFENSPFFLSFKLARVKERLGGRYRIFTTMQVGVNNPEEELVIRFFNDIYEMNQYLLELKSDCPVEMTDIEKRVYHMAVENMGRELIDGIRRNYIDPTSYDLLKPLSGKKPLFGKMMEMLDQFTMDDMHKKAVEKLMVYDPKRKVRVPSRFCSFHLAGFNLDEESTAQLGPPYEPSLSSPETGLTNYVTADAHYKLANYCTDVVSIRVVKAGPRYRYPVKVYGKVIARDEIDYKCVYLFNRERKDAQTITSEKDMLALTGPCRALVTLGFMYFEFDLKVSDKDEPDKEVQFSKGVIPYFCKADRKRIILQLPSFQSTVKLVLQHVDLPVAASIEVSVKQEHDGPFVHFNGKITAGTTRSYMQHTVLYDSSVPSSEGLLRENGALALNRNLVAVNGYVGDPALEEGEKLVLYVCFLDADHEIEDEDEEDTEPEDDDDEEDEEEDDDEDDEEEEEEEEEEDEEVYKNVVALKCPLREAVWEYGGRKLQVKVNWSAILDSPKDTDFFHRQACLPAGYSFDYRWGTVFD
ncbi:uncharacterized protein [Lolium perenne]|uniref:uncharacterized protein isoform X1 n=1 Tax=Lolium perenne TaxID=4522 RepID=UPI0021F569F8|nr:uncharacterized protein LOC127327312 isoform X1 [Lolium perenne]